MIDAYSRWLDVHIVPRSYTKVLKQVFSTHGLPYIVSWYLTMNGPAFIRHSLTSPYHPRSNGLAE